MMTLKKYNAGLASAAVGISGVAFDVLTPLGVAAGVMYVLFVLTALWFSRPYMAFIFAAISSVLTLKGYFFIADIQSEVWIVQINRAMSLLVLWTVAVMVYFQKKAEWQREKLIHELVQSNEELERFSYVCSHDLQEPLRMIRSFSEMLNDHTGKHFGDDAESKEYLDVIIEESRRAQTLVKSILTYARINKDAHKHEDIDCNALAAAVEKDLSGLLIDTGGTITWKELPHIRVNKAQLYQVFAHLIGNALIYRQPDCKPQITISCAQTPTHIQFCISDNGLGIDPQYAEKIFEVFQRLHRDPQYTGTGIGLSICKKIIEQHGGKIWVEPNQPTGSKFCFTIPIQAT